MKGAAVLVLSGHYIVGRNVTVCACTTSFIVTLWVKPPNSGTFSFSPSALRVTSVPPNAVTVLVIHDRNRPTKTRKKMA